MQRKCPCQSGLPFALCCEPLLKGERKAETAEQLMRSRYSAYTEKNVDYLKATLWPRDQKLFDYAGVEAWANTAQFIGLDILSTDQGLVSDTKGTVLFRAKYLAHGEMGEQRELSLFKKKEGSWYYVKPLPITSPTSS